MITKVVNLSLESGCFPDLLKSARVKPLIKNQNLDPEQLKNYRPISNLPTLSKVIEKVVTRQLCNYMVKNGLENKFQSAYRKAHSTETALLRVNNDVLMAVDAKKAVALVLLDLSAAFDTVDHATLCSRLETLLGLKGTVLSWFQSYLSSRSQCVSVGDALSDVLSLTFGVPQGSVLGPFLFTIYTLPLTTIANRHGVSIHLYADDTQLYVSFDASSHESFSESIHILEKCIQDIKVWMAYNSLQLNGEKTEFILFSSRHSKANFNGARLTVNEQSILPTDNASDMGVILDSSLDMKQHISNVCKISYFHLRNIRYLKPVLSNDALVTVVHAFISSRLDYCNSLLHGLPESQVSSCSAFRT